MKNFKKIIAVGLSAFLIADAAFGTRLSMSVRADEAENSTSVSGNDIAAPEKDATVSVNDIAAPENIAVMSEPVALSLDLTDGLIGYYTFDSTLENAAGNGSASLHGGAGDTWNSPATGQASYSEGKNGQAYSFAGDDGTIKGEGLQLDVAMPAAYTISYWVNPDTVNSATSMVFVPIDLNNGLNIADNWFGKTFPTVRIWGPLATAAEINDEKMCYMDNWVDTADALCGQWTYITLTGDESGNNVLYINGEQKATGSSIPGALTGMPIFLGINFWDPSFDGLMDETVIYNRALSAAEVSALYKNNGVPEENGGGNPGPDTPSSDLPEDLIGYYTFDNTLANAAGNGSASLHGGAGDTWNSPVTGQASYSAGKNGQAYSFAGDDGTIRGEGLQLDVAMPAAYTISYWVKPDTVNSATSMVFVPIDTDNGLNIADNWFGKTFPTVRIWGPLAAAADCYLDNWVDTADALCGQWTYITLTGDESGKNVLYINGEQEAAGSSIAGALTGMPVFLGINFWDPSFDGLMDDMAIYNRALSAAEVSALYKNNGVPGDKKVEIEVPYTEHVSVHDPSIIKDEKTGMYYVFGSHRAWARSRDLITWQTFTNNLSDVEECEKIFANEIAWASMGDSTYTVTGNMWAPDVIWSDALNKWCMYMSINGCSWNSCICLLTADSLDGDWEYVGPVIYSGFTSEAVHDFTKTDYTKVTGDAALNKRYAMTAYTCTGNDGKTATSPTTWNTDYGAHAIDPCIIVGDDGTWYMSYGSWSGGIYMIRLDKQTGLRDYNVTYSCEANKSDPYMGYKIAGGNFTSGEASYIQKMGDYYYLYVTLGGLTSTGGYNMRVFRSASVTGPYVDYSGDDARSQTYDYNSSVGNRVMSGYRWSHMSYGYVAQGHNSVMVDTDGRMYLFNHYRFDDGTERHEMRVHHMLP